MARRVSAQKALEMIMDMQEDDSDDVSEVGETRMKTFFPMAPTKKMILVHHPMEKLHQTRRIYHLNSRMEMKMLM